MKQIESVTRGVGTLACLLLLGGACGGDGSGRRPSEQKGVSAEQRLEREGMNAAREREAGVTGVLLEQIARYPEMEVQDLFKVLYQAAYGSGHALSDTLAARQALEDEMASLLDEATGQPADPAEPLTERLTADGGLVRVNLRPYLSAGGQSETLWRALARTSSRHAPTPESLRVWWTEAETLASEGRLPFDAEALDSFYMRQGLTGFPIPHHSNHYEATYRPAYRVIAASELRLPPR